MSLPRPLIAIRRTLGENLRWWIGGLLFASTVINYIDRQTLSVLAPFLKEEYEWSNEQF
nr:MFS transporter [Pyrinomonadaceae bacterium]